MSRSSRMTALFVAAIVGLAPLVLAPARVVAITGNPIIISAQLVIEPNLRQLVLCQDEVAYFTLNLYRDAVYRMPTDDPATSRTGKLPPAGPTRLQVTSSNAGVASVLPPFKVVSAALRFAQFKVTGNAVGSSTITIQDTAGEAAPKTIRVLTSECLLKVKSTSSWTMNFNYPLSAWGTMAVVEMHRTGLGEYNGQGVLKGSATAASIGGCIPTYRVTDSRVSIVAHVRDDGRHQWFDFEATYTKVSVTIPATCLGYGFPTKGSGDGTPGRAEFTVPAFKSARTPESVDPHPMRTALGDQPGSTEFVVWTEQVVPPPP